jgi:hypothetical protein
VYYNVHLKLYNGTHYSGAFIAIVMVVKTLESPVAGYTMAHDEYDLIIKPTISCNSSSKHLKIYIDASYISSYKIMIILLVLSVAVAQVYSCTEYDDAYVKTEHRQKLIGLFKEAIMNDRYTQSLWKLQQIYFNPDSNQSPGQVCLSVLVTVDTIVDPSCPCSNQKGPAFENNAPGLINSDWYSNTYYELELADAYDASDGDTSELAKLMTESGSSGVFYAFDPSFYSIMQTLSSSIALSVPYEPDIQYYPIEDPLSYYSNDYTDIPITIAELDDMPCWDDAVYALRSVLMWVSFNWPMS